jgi:hypothetical protein
MAVQAFGDTVAAAAAVVRAANDFEEFAVIGAATDAAIYSDAVHVGGSSVRRVPGLL